MLLSVSSIHLIHHANNSPSTRCNLSSSSSLSFSWVVRTDSSLTHSSTASSSYGSGLSPTPNLLAAPPRGLTLLHTCVSWPLLSSALPICYKRKPALHLLPRHALVDNRDEPSAGLSAMNLAPYSLLACSVSYSGRQGQGRVK